MLVFIPLEYSLSLKKFASIWNFVSFRENYFTKIEMLHFLFHRIFIIFFEKKPPETIINFVATQLLQPYFRNGTEIAKPLLASLSLFTSTIFLNKQKLERMNKVRQLFLFAVLITAVNFASAQVHLKVEAISSAANTYGVYAKVCDNIMPSGNTITGSGQVTIIYSAGMTFSSLTAVAGTWSQNAMVQNPSEAPGKIYVSMGFLADVPQIIYQPDTETLLFTFKLSGSSTVAPTLILNGVDPFDHLPNSASSNPGNELTILDFGVQPLGLYTYGGNYTGSSFTCTNNPPQDTTTQDTTIVTPPGDTTTQDTTIITPPGDTTTQDTTIITPPGDTTTQDTTIITPPGDTTQQTSAVRDLKNATEHFKLYPTPAYEWITVKFLDPAMEGGTIRLFTMNGVSIGEIKRGQKQELTLNVSGLSSGFYLIKYEKDGKTLQNGKFLKQ